MCCPRNEIREAEWILGVPPRRGFELALQSCIYRLPERGVIRLASHFARQGATGIARVSNGPWLQFFPIRYRTFWPELLALPDSPYPMDSGIFQ